MMACVLAEKTGQKKRTIAIVNKSNYNLLQDSLNIDDLVDPRMTTVSRIMEHVHRGTIGTVYSVLDGEYEFIEAKILEKSELLNKKIRESNLPEDIRIGAIVRKDQVIIPRSNFIFEKGDLVVFLAKREQLKAVENIFGDWVIKESSSMYIKEDASTIYFPLEIEPGQSELITYTYKKEWK